MRYSEYFFQQWLSRRRAKAAAGLFIIVCVIAGGVYIDKELQRTWSKVKINDRLYADTASLNDTNFHGITVYRRIKPFGVNEINKMNITKWEKEKKILRLDTNSETSQPFMIPSRLYITANLMFKYKDVFVGTFIKKDSTTAEMPEKGLKPSAAKWYAFKPNRKLCITDAGFSLPRNYVYADEYYYVDPLFVELSGKFPGTK